MAETIAYFSAPESGFTTIMIEFYGSYDEVEVAANLSIKLGSTVVPITEEEYMKLRQEADEEQVCRVCGCTWENPCAGGCYWVEDDLCSVCARV